LSPLTGFAVHIHKQIGAVLLNWPVSPRVRKCAKGTFIHLRISSVCNCFICYAVLYLNCLILTWICSLNRNVEGQWNKKCLLDTVCDCVGKVEKAMGYAGNDQ
jgi:hypothetical protein